MVKLFSTNSNVCDHNPPTSQTDRQTDDLRSQDRCGNNTISHPSCTAKRDIVNPLTPTVVIMGTAIRHPVPDRFKPLSLTVSEIFNVECNAVVDLTLIRPLHKGQVIHFGTNRFLIYDFLQAANSNFCSRTHRLATIH